MRHWNRGRRTVRNLLLALLLAFLIYASQGFPPYTVKGMCRQVRNDYLLGEVEPLYVQRDRIHLSSSSTLHLTNVAARSGDTYLFFSYRDSLLGSRRDWSAGFSTVFGEGSACIARAGKIYAAGPFEGAASAVAVVRAEKEPEPNGRVLSREFALEGTRLADQVFVFPYDAHERYLGRDADVDDLDPMELTLPEIANLWYRRPIHSADPGVYAILDRELPCTVTLYDESGGALGTFEGSVTTEGIRSWS